MAVANRYPLSTPEGAFIPLDAVRPLGITVFPFGTGTFSSFPITGTNLLRLSSLVDCYISYAVPTIPLNASGTANPQVFLLRGGIPQVVSLLDLTQLAVMGVASAGTCYIEELEVWASLKLDSQIGRI